MIEPLAAFNDLALDLASSSNCNSASINTQPKTDVSCQEWNECDGGRTIKLCNVEQLGHEWPSGNTLPICETIPNSNACLLWHQTVGPSSTAIDNSFQWDFLSAHQLKNSVKIPALPLLGSLTLTGLIMWTVLNRKNKLKVTISLRKKRQ